MRRSTVTVLAMALAAWPIAACAAPPTTQPATQPDKPKVERFRGRVIGNIDRVRFPEPSDLCFHPTRKTLFVVSDQGWVAEMTTAGGLSQRKRILGRYADLEGITLNPDTGMLYVAVEGEDRILEVDQNGLAVKRTFTIPRTFEGKTVLPAGGNGIEAIAFVPDPKNREGGTFFVSNQGYNRAGDEPSGLIELLAPLASSSKPQDEARIVHYYPQKIVDIAALSYDARRKVLYATADSPNLLVVFSTDGRELARYTALPGRDQEGLAFDADGFMYLAQDSGGIVRLKWEQQPK